MMTMTQSIQSSIVTLHDAITDAPVYRAATLHFDKQLDAFSLWITDLVQQTKSYTEKLKELNAETIYLTNKLNPTAIVGDYLLDSNIVGVAARNYGDALKTSLTFKLEAVSDLEDKFTQPIQRFADQHIRDFKVFRDRHERVLKNYEGALAKYATINDHDSALANSTTAQLDKARKAYIEMSSEHVIRIVKLRHDLEHLLVQQFSTSTTLRKEFFDNAQVWNQLDSMLFAWTKWLAEDKRTSRFEIKQQQLAQQTLEKECLKGVQCEHGDIGNIKAQSSAYSKSGYLFAEKADNTSSSSWVRQWFFVHDGYFGSCEVSNPEMNASITVDNCLPLHSCQAKHMDISNRRFCFEVTSRQQPHRSRFVLQAETEHDLTEWLAAFISNSTARPSSTNTQTPCKSNRPSSIIIGSYGSNDDPSRPSSPALLLAKPRSTTAIITPTDIPATFTTASSLSNSSGFSNISNLSSSPSGTIHSILSRPYSNIAVSSRVKVTCTTPASTPLLLCEITKRLPQLETTLDELSESDKLWGTPRYVISYGTGNAPLKEKHQQSRSTGDSEIGISAWRRSSEYPLPQERDNSGNRSSRNCKNQELRRLFYGVSDEEVVLEVFMASYLKKKPPTSVSNGQHNNIDPLTSLDSSYYYGGCVYVTQDTLWFYSKVSLNCVTSVVLKLKDIENIEVDHRATKMTIGIVDDSDPISPLVFSFVQDDITTVVKKLRLLVYNAKLENPMSVDRIQQKMIAIASPTPSLSSTASSTERSSLNDSPCSPILESHNMDIPSGSSSRMTSSTTINTMGSASTLTTSESDIVKTTAKEPACNKKTVSKHFIGYGLPKHITKPSEPVNCDCQDHLDRCVAQVELPISGKQLYEIMFSDELTGPSTNGGVWHSKTEGIGGRDLRISGWKYLDSDDNQQQEPQMKRVLKYWMPVANPIVRIKEAEVVETQTLLKKNDYLCYVVQISTKTESLPFADAFVPSVRYCITYVNEFQCKLTCSMGVKWLKWIMAKMIVTRAALSGMSDSINVFVPILKDEANTIQTSVNTNVPESHGKTDDGAIDTKDEPLLTTTITTTTSTQNPETTIDTTITENGSTNYNSQLNNTPSQHSISTPSTMYPSSLIPMISTMKLRMAQLHQLLRNTSRDLAFQKAPPLIKSTTSITRPFSLWILGATLIGCLVYAAIYWVTSCAVDRPSFVTQSQVIAHAVYLRDLDEGFIKNSLQPPYGESKSYIMFLKSRQGEQRYQWHDALHYRLAQDYHTDHEQLGILRHSLINMFHSLNMADTYLLENEYLNWLLDYRQRCRHEHSLIQQHILENNDNSSYLCDQVNNQIGTYF